MTSRQQAYIEAYQLYDGDESAIQTATGIHATQQRRLAEDPLVQASIQSTDESWVPTPNEPELLSEILTMARKANALGKYPAASVAYEMYGRRAYGWRSETRTEITGKDGDAIEIRSRISEQLDRIAISVITGSGEDTGSAEPLRLEVA